MEENAVNTGSPTSAKKGSRWKIIFIILVLVIILGAIGYFFFGRNTEKLSSTSGTGEESTSTQFIQADFIDLSKVFSISKFRSGSGHDFSQGSGESCRSMKHYFAPQESQARQTALSANQGFPPAPDGNNDIPIYSPVDGKITGVQAEKTPIGEQIYIEPTGNSDYQVRLFHVYLDNGIAKGITVKVGQKIGDISQYSSTDIAITKRKLNKVTYLSYFEVMPDTIFAKYQARGVKTRDDLILSKEYRDANPLKCNGEQFAENYDSDPNFGNFVYLSGSTMSVTGTAGTPSGTPSQQGTPSAGDTVSGGSSSTSTSSGSVTSGGSTSGSGGGAGTGGGTGGGR